MITESCMSRVLNLHGHLVGRNRSLQVVRKQFALRPATARTTHRSQGLPPGDRQAHFVRNRVFGMGVHKSTINLKGVSIVNLVLNLLSAPIAIILNSFTIYVMKKASLLPKPLKALMLSLAVSDLVVGLIAQPLFIAVEISGY